MKEFGDEVVPVGMLVQDRFRCGGSEVVRRCSEEGNAVDPAFNGGDAPSCLSLMQYAAGTAKALEKNMLISEYAGWKTCWPRLGLS